MPQRFLGQFDMLTGEVIEDPGVLVWVGRKVRSPYGRNWMQVNQDAMEVLAADEDMDSLSLRVFVYLNSRLDFENYIRVPQTEMVEFFKKPKQNINRAVKKLERKGILLPGPKVDRSSVWRLNPNYGWKGKVVNLQKAQAERNLQLVRNGSEESRRHQQERQDLSQADLEALGQARLL